MDCMRVCGGYALVEVRKHDQRRNSTESRVPKSRVFFSHVSNK